MHLSPGGHPRLHERIGRIRFGEIMNASYVETVLILWGE